MWLVQCKNERKGKILLPETCDELTFLPITVVISEKSYHTGKDAGKKVYPLSKGRKTSNKSRPTDDLFVGISRRIH